MTISPSSWPSAFIVRTCHLLRLLVKPHGPFFYYLMYIVLRNRATLSTTSLNSHVRPL